VLTQTLPLAFAAAMSELEGAEVAAFALFAGFAAGVAACAAAGALAAGAAVGGVAGVACAAASTGMKASLNMKHKMAIHRVRVSLCREFIISLFLISERLRAQYFTNRFLINPLSLKGCVESLRNITSPFLRGQQEVANSLRRRAFPGGKAQI